MSRQRLASPGGPAFLGRSQFPAERPQGALRGAAVGPAPRGGGCRKKLPARRVSQERGGLVAKVRGIGDAPRRSPLEQVSRDGPEIAHARAEEYRPAKGRRLDPGLALRVGRKALPDK